MLFETTALIAGVFNDQAIVAGATPGEIHRIENPGTDLLHVIEVQVGDYLGEDDIERLDDCYGRA